ncbi:MAG TPA: hypothetical protein VGF65_11445 [Mycobacterium sp.]|jgi:hypothetical protein
MVLIDLGEFTPNAIRSHGNGDRAYLRIPHRLIVAIPADELDELLAPFR